MEEINTHQSARYLYISQRDSISPRISQCDNRCIVYTRLRARSAREEDAMISTLEVCAGRDYSTTSANNTTLIAAVKAP